MVIKTIALENFKCYKEIKIDLSKITLLTGANSSGKSSLIYSILGAIQSGEFPFQFSPNGKYVKMGDFTEVIHGQDPEKHMKLEFVTTGRNDEDLETVTTYWRRDKIRNLPTLQTLIAHSPYYKLKINRLRKYDLEFEYFPEKDTNKLSRSPEIFNKLIETIGGLFPRTKSDKDDSDESVTEVTLKKISNLKNKIKFKFTNFSELQSEIRDKGNYYLQIISSSLEKSFRDYDSSANYISSFRLFPERTYYETSKNDLKIGKFGENYEDQIISWETNKDPKFKELSDILEDLGLLNGLKSNRLAGGRFEILVKNKPNGIWSSITDVGFGISQFLPIIVADLQLEANSTLFIAQPEIHLHPKIQAQFADYIVSRISKSKKNYVIETHSEYLINRLRLAVVDKKVGEQDIKTYYIENDGTEASHYELNFKTNGQIENAPESFFDTYMLDVMNIAINAE